MVRKSKTYISNFWCCRKSEYIAAAPSRLSCPGSWDQCICQTGEFCPVTSIYTNSPIIVTLTNLSHCCCQISQDRTIDIQKTEARREVCLLSLYLRGKSLAVSRALPLLSSKSFHLFCISSCLYPKHCSLVEAICLLWDFVLFREFFEKLRATKRRLGILRDSSYVQSLPWAYPLQGISVNIRETNSLCYSLRGLSLTEANFKRSSSHMARFDASLSITAPLLVIDHVLFPSVHYSILSGGDKLTSDIIRESLFQKPPSSEQHLLLQARSSHPVELAIECAQWRYPTVRPRKPPQNRAQMI